MCLSRVHYVCNKKSDFILRNTLGEVDISIFSVRLLISWLKTDPMEHRLKITLSPHFHILLYPIPFTTVSYPKQLRRFPWGAKGSPLGSCGFRATFGNIPCAETLEDCLPPAPWFCIINTFLLCSGAPQIQRVMTMMIRDHEVLFPKSKDAPLSPPVQKNDPKKPPVARSSVGWDATEDAPISRTDSFSNTVRCKESFSFHLTLPLAQVIPFKSYFEGGNLESFRWCCGSGYSWYRLIWMHLESLASFKI